MMKYFATLLFVLLPSTAFAATLSFSQLPASVGMGDTVQITLSVDSSERVNAFSGTLTYSKNLVPVSVSDGHSIVPLWIEAPHITSSSVVFAGTVPGGFIGKGTVLSVVFRAQSAGDAHVAIEDAHVLENDGNGTPASIYDAPYTFSVGPTPEGGYKTPDDTTPPEAFAPLLEVGPDGNMYLDFATTDTGSGVDHYEISEHRAFLPGSSTFTVASSPYVLRDQYLTSDIEVRAIDTDGNVRTEIYPHTREIRPYEEGAAFAILIGVVVFLYLYFRRHVSLSWTNTL